jgi:hypothetical protein
MTSRRHLWGVPRTDRGSRSLLDRPEVSRDEPLEHRGREVELLEQVLDGRAPAQRLESSKSARCCGDLAKMRSRCMSDDSSLVITATRRVFCDGVGAAAPVRRPGSAPRSTTPRGTT